jgi:capsule polysaccharide export protein KpsE/RkpR
VVVAGILNVNIPQSGVVLAALGVLILLVVVLVYFTKLVSDESFTNTSDMMKLVGGSASLGIGVILAAVGGILAILGGWLIVAKKA